MIKRIYPLLGGLLFSVSAMAQSSSDALLLSNQQPSGTARTQALGGASVGLGGDYSSAYTNPAGIAMFKTGEFLISAGVGISNNKSSYLGNSSLDNSGSRTNFQLPNVGVIFATNKGSGPSSWNNITFSLGMNRLANYNNKFAFAGHNTKSSITDSWLDAMSGQTIDYIKTRMPLDGGLAFGTGVIDTMTTAGSLNLISLATPDRTFGGPITIQQRGTVTTEGGLNEYNFAIGGNYGDRLYIGAAISLPSVNYKETTSISEDDATGNKNNYFSYLDYNLYLKRTGLGIGAKVGVLYKFTDRLRVGGAIHTPVYYSLHDSYSADLTANTENYFNPPNQDITVRSSDVGGNAEYDFNITTPWRFMGGASYFIGNIKDPKAVQGFITADYEYVNQGSSKFRISDDKNFERTLNSNVSNLYQGVSNLKVGAEIKFATFLAARAGFAYYGNPYTSDAYNRDINNSTVDASRKIYSGGLGFRNKGLYVDLTYSYAQGKDRYHPYTTQQAALTPPPATMDFTRSNIMLTMGLKF
ncbi:OmpP1/FadL family transporter [Chitinophaga vietnamensis]|uniref:OmpP1/FadL family transporter n=1 Tax=Chitinophaga vietnamensis TaxID=2593957 RepID=UPI001178C7B4|nr:outer membrane protein transport protein [Chitinophaga vietnamensis]